MTNQDLVNLYQGLHQVSNLSGVKFVYAVAKNINQLKPEIAALDEALKPSAEYQKYDEARMELAKSLAVREDNGEPRTRMIQPGQREYVMADQAAFDKALGELRAKYTKTLADREEQMKAYEALLKEKIELPVLFKVNLDEIPKDINGQQMISIIAIINEV